MKRILFIGIILSFVACEEVLKEEPKTIVAENFYQKAEDLETAVNAIFGPLRVYNCMSFLYPCQLEAYSDFAQGRGSYAVLSNFQGLDNTNITRIGSMWDEFYLSIRNANLVIANSANAKSLAPEVIAKYVAEARFMRAFTYFHMIRNWGKIILRTELNYTELHVPLSNSDDVYKLITEDLLFAEQNLPDAPSVPGRPTKWAAKSVLADVYFTLNKQSEAMNKANEVIQSNKFSLVEVSTVDDFQKIYGPTVINTPEEIFYLKFSRESGWSYVEFLHHPSDPYYNKAGLFALYLDTMQYTVYRNWDNADLRKKNWYPWNFGLGVHTLLTKKIIDPGRISAGGNDYPLYRYADVLLLYAEAACRANNGPNADAMEKLNMVHRRGYGMNSKTPSAVDFKLSDYSSMESFIDLVIKERGYETYLEGGKRWLDLKRSGKYKEIIKAGTGKDVADKHMFWPIPVNEIDLNDAIEPGEQNPGY